MTPAGRALRTSSIALSRAVVTSREFSPIRMKPRPSTASPWPSAVTPPRRITWPIATSATSRTRIGTPSWAAMTTSAISSTECGAADPLDQARLARADDVAAADVLVVLAAGRRTTSSSVSLYLASFIGSARTSNCFARPPQELISATPGTRRRRGRMTQSCSVRSSVRSIVGSCSSGGSGRPRPGRSRPGPSRAGRPLRAAGPRPAAR